MEHKPKFCSECGAKLTGSAAFCPECGAKQEFAAAPVVAAVVEAAPAPAPVPEVAPMVEIVPAPAPEVAPVVVPVPLVAPETSLAAPKKASISVIGLILAIGALCLSLLGSLLVFMLNWRNISWQSPKFDVQMLLFVLRNPDFLVGLFTGLVVPLIALVMVLIKKKPAAIIGMALIALLIVCQLVITGSYMGLMRGKPGIFRHLPISVIAATNMVNGENLFYVLRSLFHGAYRGALLPLSTSLFFHLKNYLALIGCLAAFLKKRK